MKDIKCPKCGTVFQVDESDYAAILAQVRNEELDRRVEELREQFRAKEQSVKLEAEKTFEGKLSQKDQEVSRLQNEITRLTGVISGYEATKKSELSELENKKTKELFDAVTEKDRLISRLEAEIANKDNEHRVAILKERSNGSVEIQKKQQEIVKLQADIES